MSTSSFTRAASWSWRLKGDFDAQISRSVLELAPTSIGSGPQWAVTAFASVLSG